MRVLVVDDDPEARRAVRRALAQHEVLEAEDAADCLAHAEKRGIDAVILPTALRDMSGLDLVSALRRQDPSLHILVLTNSVTESEVVQVLAQGADDCMGKPFSAPELTARMGAAERRRSAIEWSPAASDAPAFVVVHGAVAQVNDATLAFIGAGDRSQVVGRSVFDFVAPDSIGAVEARYTATQTGSWPPPETVTVVRLDGEPVFVELSSVPITWRGQPASQISLWDLRPFHPTAGRADAPADEETDGSLGVVGSALRGVTSDAVVVLDMRWRVQRMNPAAEELSGYRESELIGRFLGKGIPWLENAETMASARTALADRGHWHGTVLLRRRDRLQMSVRVTSTLLRDSAGEPSAIILVMGRENADVSNASNQDIAFVSEIRRGIACGEFLVHYQPIVRLGSERVTGAEALVRWCHPERGMLHPADFMAAAEESNAIVELGEFVLREASMQWAKWHASGHDLEISVNLSGRQLADVRLAEMIAACPLPPGALWLEVTETSLISDLDQAADTLQRIAASGARIAIDDFGTGWGSLSYLRQFPVHALKIDRVFVNALGAAPVNAAIVGSVISLGRELNLKVIAEGIETTTQQKTLSGMGCELGQGYLFGRPVQPDEFVVTGG